MVLLLIGCAEKSTIPDSHAVIREAFDSWVVRKEATNHPICKTTLFNDGTLIADVFGMSSITQQDSLVKTLRECETPPTLVRFWKPESMRTMRAVIDTMASNSLPSKEELDLDIKENLLREVTLNKI